MPIDLKPTEEMAANARRGLELRRKHGRGGLSTQEAARQGIGSGVARAASLANRQNLSPDTVKRMKSYFARHTVDKQGEGWGSETNPSAGYIAWLLWGGDAGRDWAERKVKEMEQETQQAAEASPAQAFADIGGQMSYGDMRELLEKKLRERYRPPMMGTTLEYALDGPYLMDFNDGQCVVRMEGQHFRYPYQMQGRECEMGEPVPVRLSWEDLQEDEQEDEPAMLSESVHPFAFELNTRTFAEAADTVEIEVCRDGEWDHPKYGKVKVDQALRNSFIANFQAKAVKMAELPLDYDHEPGPAPGWIVGLKNAGKRLMAIVKPTPSGREKVQAGEYRFFSPEWHPNYRDPQTGKEYGPTLLRGALTNRPFFKGMEPVQFSEPEQAGQESAELDAGGGAPDASREEHPMSEETQTATPGVQNGAEAAVDAAKFAEMEQRIQAVEQENSQLRFREELNTVTQAFSEMKFGDRRQVLAPGVRGKLAEVAMKLQGEDRKGLIEAVRSIQFAELGERGFVPVETDGEVYACTPDEEKMLKKMAEENRMDYEDLKKTYVAQKARRRQAA